MHDAHILNAFRPIASNENFTHLVAADTLAGKRGEPRMQAIRAKHERRPAEGVIAYLRDCPAPRDKAHHILASLSVCVWLERHLFTGR